MALTGNELRIQYIKGTNFLCPRGAKAKKSSKLVPKKRAHGLLHRTTHTEKMQLSQLYHNGSS